MKRLPRYAVSIFLIDEDLNVIQGDPQVAVPSAGSFYTNLFSALGVGITMGKFDSNGNPLWHIFKLNLGR